MSVRIRATIISRMTSICRSLLANVEQLYTFDRHALVATSQHVVVEWWLSDAAFNTRGVCCALDCEGDWDVVQLALGPPWYKVLVTDATRCPSLVKLLSSPNVLFVGKDLARDRQVFHEVTLSTPGWWSDVTDPLPMWGSHAPMETLVRQFCARRYSWKRLVNHEICPPPWARGLGWLLPVELFYAAADACAVSDVIVAMARLLQQKGRPSSSSASPTRGVDANLAPLPLNLPPAAAPRSRPLQTLHCPTHLLCPVFAVEMCHRRASMQQLQALTSELSSSSRFVRGTDAHLSAGEFGEVLAAANVGMVILRDVQFPEGPRRCAVLLAPPATAGSGDLDGFGVCCEVSNVKDRVHLEAAILPGCDHAAIWKLPELLTVLERDCGIRDVLDACPTSLPAAWMAGGETRSTSGQRESG